MGTDPYANLTDAEVLARAREKLEKAASMPPKTIQRELAFAVFDGAMRELDRRAAAWVLARLRAQDGEDGEGGAQ